MARDGGGQACALSSTWYFLLGQSAQNSWCVASPSSTGCSEFASGGASLEATSLWITVSRSPPGEMRGNRVSSELSTDAGISYCVL